MSGRVKVLVLGAVCFVTAVGVVDSKHLGRKAFVELQRLEAQRDRMNVEWGRLLLEEGAWSAHGRIEQTARERLGMRTPRAEDVVIVRRKTGR